MSIASVCAAIADTGRGIPGITSAISRSPVKLDSYELPCLLALSGAAVYPGADVYGDLLTEQREYRAQVVVSAQGQGDIEAIEARAETLLQATAARFLSAPALGTTGLTSQVTGDTGVIELLSFDGGYIGFEVRLQVTETRLRTYAPGQ